MVIKHLISLLLLCTFFSDANEVLEQFPQEINAQQKYVFYSHGRIVEGVNATPTHPRWGRYEFPQVKAALADSNYVLIAYHRAKNTEPKQFAMMLADDVNTLINKGVKPENISLVGFSRGGEITIMASNYLASSYSPSPYSPSKKVNIALLASCPDFMKNSNEFEVYGEVFSIYETSDLVGSCQFLIDNSKDVTSFKEISISTGQEHGAFYTPIPEWVKPLKTWLKR